MTERGRHAKVLTVSDGVSEGTRDDTAGPALVARLEESDFDVVEHRVSPDGITEVRAALEAMTDGFAGLVVSTGGTGFGPRDLTPEATRAVIEREAPGFAEAMRNVSKVPFGLLSRSVAGAVGQALVVNVPGSEKGALECLEAVLPAVPHALDLLAGLSEHH